MLLAQLSDTHILAEGLLKSGVDSAATLGRCIEAVNGLDPQPDLVILTGDLAHDGRPDQYARLRGLLGGLRAPYRLLPGNHDDRDALRAAFPDTAVGDPEAPDGFLHGEIPGYPIRLIALDTVVPGEVGGAQCADRLDWLAKTLAVDDDRPVTIVMHHPPFICGIDEFDQDPMIGASALAALIVASGTVQRVLCGHLHRPMQVQWAGTLACAAPSTAIQFGLDLTPGAKVTWTGEPPGYLLHHWPAGRPPVTHVRFLD